MRIERIEVEEFEALRGRNHRLIHRTERGLVPSVGGLVVLEGPNEAGKSTLLRFIQTLLFGNELVRGALVLSLNGDSYRLQQNGRRQTLTLTDLASGEPLDRARLEGMIGRLDGKVYRSIFAFGLSELQDLNKLTDSEVQERIYSASIAGAGRSAREAMRTLAGQLDEMLKPRADSTLLATLAQQLRDKQAQVQEARKSSTAYAELLQQEGALRGQIEEQQELLTQREGELRRYTAVLELWPVWKLGQEAFAELKGLKEINDIPTDALARLEQAHGQAEERRLEIEEATELIEERKEEIRGTSVEPRLLELAPRIANVTDLLALQLQRLEEDLPQSEEAVEGESQLLHEQLAALGDDWDEERVAQPDAAKLLPSALIVDERWLAAATEIRGLDSELAAHRQRRAQHQQQSSNLRRSEQELARRATQLGPEWDEKRLADFDLGPEWRHHAAAEQERFAEKAKEQREADARLAGVESSLETAKEQLARAPAPDRERSQLEPEEARLNAHISSLEALQGHLVERVGRKQEVIALEGALTAVPTGITPGAPLRWASLLFAVAGPLAVAYFIYSSAASAAYALAALALLLLVLLWPRSGSSEASSGGPEDPRATLTEQLRTAKSRLQECEQQISTNLQTLDLPSGAGAGEVQGGLSVARNELQDCRTELAALAEHEKATHAVARAQENLARCNDTLRALAEAKADLVQQWRQWCSQQRLSGVSSPDAMTVFVDRVEHARSVVQQLQIDRKLLDELEQQIGGYRKQVADLSVELGEAPTPAEPEELVPAWSSKVDEQLERRQNQEQWLATLEQAQAVLGSAKSAEEKLQNLKKRIAEWERQAHEVLNDAGRDASSTGQQLLDDIRALEVELKGAAEADRRVTALEEKCEQLEESAAGSRRRLQQQQEAIQKILTATGATDGDDLEERLQLQEKHQVLEATVAKAERELDIRFGAQADEATVILAQSDPLTWQQREAELAGEATKLGEELNGDEGLRPQLGGIKAQYEAIAESSDLATYQAEAEHLRQQLSLATREWVVLKLAERMIQETLAAYERTRVPEVLRHASHSLEQITGGRYVRIQSSDTRELRVFTPDDRVLDAQHLSRGTQEQLYLAVRLGLIEAFTEHSGSLPLVLDDVLVNADPERKALLVDALARTSERHQVIYLTCHPSTAALFRARVPESVHIELRRLEASGYRSVADLPPETAPGAASSATMEHEERILALLERVQPEGLARRDICEQAGVPDYEFTRAINALVASESIEKRGRKRGTTYRIAQVTA